MTIKSNFDNALQDAGGIIKIGNDIKLPGAGSISVTGVSAQDNCEGCYSQLQGELVRYNSILIRDAGHISAIAQAWEEIDQAVKNQY